MNRRYHLHILIFSFALLMVLLRPYAAYRIARNPDIAKDPVKVNGLLQRLVKKKDERHALADNEFIAIQQPKTGSVLPAVQILLIAQLFLIFAIGISHIVAASALIFKRYSNKHYLLFARLQI